ncbi:hypothetical protein [Geoalkalibacter halelectricus]|uniref:Uncharacterized protein n=1 Tax=Geoalkalibacter halelectricus TaxID=2847045 RepID=A0ABY5ZLE7_9BACT|nr:hypothetical protein [Geoalkalibacter halelectricus]MDO3377085.1 hypothetical protein [Geoalkalibacter halelectricus]UWZ79418.1 hypothetical protein L9S41_17305 [Geoalkalibacter halelectricus]
MKRPSRRWWRAGATSLAALLALSTLAQSGQEDGLRQGAQFVGRYGSPEALRESLGNPLLSSEAQLATLDGATRFSAQLSFPSSRRLLEVFAQPGATGDLTQVIIAQDLDFTGRLEAVEQLPFAVSGVCANGVISCTPGTWEQCRHFLWGTRDDGRLFLQPAQVFDLGGCYCINNACGDTLVWRNLPQVLNTLGGGAVGALQAAHPHFAVSQVEIDGPRIAYFGQDRARPLPSADKPPAAGAPLPETRYLSDPFLLADALDERLAAQTPDPLSPYRLLAGLSERGTAGEKRACAMRRVIQVSEIHDRCDDPLPETILPPVLQEIGADGICRRNYDLYREILSDTCRTLEDDRTCRLEQELVDGVATYRQFNPTGLAPLPQGRYVAGSSFLHNSLLWRHAVGWENINASVFERFVDLRAGDTLAFSIVKTQHTTPSGCQHTVVKLRVETEDGEIVGDRTDGGAYTLCWNIGHPYFVFAYAVPSDGAHGFRISGGGYDPGKHSLNSEFRVRLIRESRRGQTFERPWWSRDRTYLCEQPGGHDFADLKERLAAVVTSTAEAQGRLSFEDRRRDAQGAWVDSSHAADLPQAAVIEECEPVCKTRRPKVEAQVAVAGTAVQARTEPLSFEFFYRPCREMRCPVEPGEEIVQDCRCLNEFAEAAAIMQTLRLAGRDQICSDGAAKSLP